jgi:hypothetical protein
MTVNIGMVACVYLLGIVSTSARLGEPVEPESTVLKIRNWDSNNMLRFSLCLGSSFASETGVLSVSERSLEVQLRGGLRIESSGGPLQ